MNSITRSACILFSAAFVLYGCRSGRGFSESGPEGFIDAATVGEKTMTIRDQPADVIVHINSPDRLDRRKRTRLIYFALPNGNSIEWTAGKKTGQGDDWHYDIQHIAAQTRYLRKYLDDQNIITVYLATKQKSWPAWKRAYPDYADRIRNLVESVNSRFASLKPAITLNSHSGGGGFIFGYLDGITAIPSNIDRIAFIDSSYGYEEKYAGKLINWLAGDSKRYLNVLAYNDSVVVYDGKPLVSPTGGTWYRSKLMRSDLAKTFTFNTSSDTTFIRSEAKNGRIQFVLKENPGALIFHTHQVGLNGFIFSNVSGTRDEQRLNFTYFGEPVYKAFISDREERIP